MAYTLQPGAISIHAPLAGRDHSSKGSAIRNRISIHAPLAGRDFFFGFRMLPAPYFNPRAPCGARLYGQASVAGCIISIHAPLAGRDGFRPVRSRRCQYFNPRAPCGARPSATMGTSLSKYFNPRAPCGARLQAVAHHGQLFDISIHAPLAGRDAIVSLDTLLSKNFNPRAPCGARQYGPRGQ